MSEQTHTGTILRDVGMARTLEAEGDRWLEQAMRALTSFAALPEWRTFKAEDFRAWYIAQGYPAPHSHKVWGGLTGTAARRGVIRWTRGYAPAMSPKTHSHDVKVWEGVLWRKPL